MSAYAITNVRIFDGTGRQPFAGEVVVEGNRITAVTPVSAGASSPAGASVPRREDTSSSGSAGARPEGATVIDGRGATLMPGLIEAHAHLSFADLTAHELTRLPPEEHMLATVRNARTMLDSGYTSAFSAASAKPRLDVVLRREIEAGRVPGPRLLANGPELTVSGGLGDTNQLHLPYHDTPAFAWVVNGPAEIQRAARLLAREGVDLLKINVSGDHGTSSASAEDTVMTDAEVAAAMEIARSRGLRVAGHCRSADSVLMALRHGVEVIYHANFSDERALDALEAARDRVFVAPAFAITYNLAHATGQWGVTPARAARMQQELEATVETMGRMRKRGIRVLPGGDYGFPWTPHGTYARDLWLFVKVLGFSPMETLVAATRLGGAIMGMPGELGVVTRGALADLLLIDGEPLTDIEVLQDRNAIRMIMKHAELYK
jgi:imidazolonepropionase-like amidohydrolase